MSSQHQPPRMLTLKVTTAPATNTRRISVPRDNLSYASLITSVQNLLQLSGDTTLQLEMHNSSSEKNQVIKNGETLRTALDIFESSASTCMHLVAKMSVFPASPVGISVRTRSAVIVYVCVCVCVCARARVYYYYYYYLKIRLSASCTTIPMIGARSVTLRGDA